MKSALKITFVIVMLQLLLAGCSKKDPIFIAEPSPTYSITVTPFNNSILQGTTQAFIATRVDTNGVITDVSNEVLWSSNQQNIASINSHGVASGLAVGSTQITALLGDVSGESILSVNNKTIQSLTVTPPLAITIAGLSKQFIAAIIFTDKTSQDITRDANWASDNTAIATVNEEGSVEAIAQGIANITATLNSHSGSAQLDILGSTPTKLEIQPAIATMPVGITLDYKALLTLSDGHILDITHEMLWSSNHSSVAVISNDEKIIGRAIGIKSGTAKINTSITLLSTQYTAVADLTISPAEITKLQIIPQHINVPTGAYGQLKAIAYYTDGSAHDVTSISGWQSDNEAVAKVESGTTTPGFAYAEGTGNATITANYNGISSTTSATITTATLQRIEINPANKTTPIGVDTYFTATGVFSDFSKQVITQFVHWSSSDKSIAVMDGLNLGLAHSVAPGNTVIAASYKSISGNASLEISPATIDKLVITPPDASTYKNGVILYTAEAIFTDGTHHDITSDTTWTSADSSVFGFGGGNAGTAQSVGHTTVTASYSDTSATPVVAITENTGITVTNAVITGLEISPLTKTTATGISVQYTSTARLSDHTAIDVTSNTTWLSSDETIASINKLGLADTTATGTATITSSIAGHTADATLTVTDAVLNSIVVYPKDITLPAGVGQHYSAVGKFSDRDEDITHVVVWDSSAPAIASITNALGHEGEVNTLSIGTTNITATYNGQSGATRLTVGGDILTSITVTCINTNIFEGTSTQCSATGIFQGSDTYSIDITEDASWLSSDDTVAAVNNIPGTFRAVSGLKIGTADITATFDGQSDALTVTVLETPRLLSIKVTSEHDKINVGDTEQFKAEGHYSGGIIRDITQEVLWNTDRTQVITISNEIGKKGLATAIGAGDTFIGAQLGLPQSFKPMKVVN